MAPDFEVVFREQFPRLVALGVTMTGSRDAGQDLAQETMVRALRHWPQIAEYEQLGAWLRRVLCNLVIDRARRLTVESSALQLASGSAHPAGIGDVELSQWNELIAGLPPMQRVVVGLFYGEDRSVDDIAGILEISAGTVKSTLWKARRQLRADATEVKHG